MPYSPLSLCLEPGCVALVQSGRCTEHQREHRRAARPSAAARGYDDRWRKFRAEYLRAHPLCSSPSCQALPFYIRPEATDVDHLDGAGPLGPRGYDPANLQALCHSCHSRKTATENGGFGRISRSASRRGRT